MCGNAKDVWRARGQVVGRNGEVHILKSQLATQCTIKIDYRAEIWEFLWICHWASRGAQWRGGFLCSFFSPATSYSVHNTQWHCVLCTEKKEFFRNSGEIFAQNSLCVVHSLCMNFEEKSPENFWKVHFFVHLSAQCTLSFDQNSPMNFLWTKILGSQLSVHNTQWRGAEIGEFLWNLPLFCHNLTSLRLCICIHTYVCTCT